MFKIFIPVCLLFSSVARLVAQAPTNDNPCSAAALSIAQNCQSPAFFSSLNATPSTPNGYIPQGCADAAFPKDVWFSFKTTSSGAITDVQVAVSTTGALIGQIRLFSALNCAGPFTEVNQICNSNPNNLQLIASGLSPGTTYYVMCSTYWDITPGGSFGICITPPPIAGCTNPLATNFNPNATVDNGTCTFSVSPENTCGLYSSSPERFISNAAPLEDVINISLGSNRVVTDMDVVIKLTHSFIGDLQVTLTSPNNKSVDLFKNMCGSNDNMEIRFDDASYQFQCGSPSKGYYRLPLNYLSAFNDELVSGDWTLKVSDETPGDNGILQRWCLIPKTRIVNCIPPSNGSATAVTATSATLIWNTQNVPAETTWNIEYGPKGFIQTGIPSIINFSESPLTLTGLLPKTGYDFYLQSNCTAGIKSAWSGPFSFVTAINNGDCNLGLNVPDQTCNANNNFVVNVNNAAGNSLGVNIRLQEVKLIVRHTWLSDISLSLISPSGKTVVLSAKNGLSNDNYGDPNFPGCTRFTSFVQNYECAAVPIKEGIAPFIGKFYPEGNLAEFHDGTNPNGNWILQICDDVANDLGKLEFVELVFNNNNCLAPEVLSISEIRDTSLKVNWKSNNATCANTFIEYGPRGFTPGAGNNNGQGGKIIELNCPLPVLSSTIVGLLPNQEYDIYVREKCGINQFSPNSCFVSTQTNCHQKAVTITEDFDNQVLCQTSCGVNCQIAGIWKNDGNDDFDWLVNAGPTPSSFTGPDDDVNQGGKYIYVEAGSTGACQNGKIAALVSECIKVEAGNVPCAMSFFYHLYGSEIGKLTLEISIEGAPWIILWEESGNKGNRWIKQYIDLQAYNNKNAQFKFSAYGGSGTKSDIALDRIEFYGSSALGTPLTSYYRDFDKDGYGDINYPISICNSKVPPGYADNFLDCNDRDININPGRIEIPTNRIDENCNGNADDSILATPVFNNPVICEGQNALVYASKKATGQYYWYLPSNTKNAFTTGDSVRFNGLYSNREFLVKDSVLILPGPRITEINPNALDAIEIQNVGKGKDFTGWIVAIGVANGNSTMPINTYWNLGYMGENEVQYRTKLTYNNYFGVNFDWNSGRKGWAMIINQLGIVQDFVSWNTSQVDFDNFSALINGKLYNGQDLPWSGIGVSTNCGSLATIQLSANGEKNSVLDYNACATNTIGFPNGSFNVSYPCSSTLAIAKITVTAYPKLALNTIPEVCQGAKIDIRNVDIKDLNATSGYYTYHSFSPGTAANEIRDFEQQIFASKTIYVKKITFGGSCTDEKAVSIKMNANPSASITSSAALVCSDQTKTLNASYTGGSGNVSYYWNTGSISGSINAGASFPAADGFYALTVSDAKGCRDSASVQIAKGIGISGVRIVKVQNASNCSSNDGRIQLQPLDGIAPFNVVWSGSSGGSKISPMDSISITGLKNGNYSISITDSSPLGCKIVIPFIAIGTPKIEVVVDSVRNVTCFGAQDGRIELKNVGNQQVTYLWNNGFREEDLPFLNPGKYSVTITNGICTQVLTDIQVKEPPPIAILSALISDVSCTSNGKIILNPVGGKAPYTYLWNNNVKTKDLTNVPEGRYKVVVTDANNCKYSSGNFEVKNAAILTIKAELSSNLCFGDKKGKIDVQVNGGSRPYNFSWSNSSNVEDAENLSAGLYRVSVTDKNGCQVISPFYSVTEPSEIKVNSTLFSPTCRGINDGAIQLNVNGGSGSTFTYLWSNGSRTSRIDLIGIGQYSVTISDISGCSIYPPVFNLKAIKSVKLDNVSIQDESCFGKTDGSIRPFVSGGQLPLQYKWNSGQLTKDIEGVASGKYLLDVKDAQGCLLTTDTFVLKTKQILEIEKDSLVAPTCPGGNDGKIFLSIKGGTGNYTYQWHNNIVSQNLFNLSSGRYSVTASDANGCKLLTTITLSEPPKFELKINTLDSITCFGNDNACLDIDFTGGTSPYEYRWNKGSSKVQDLCGVVAGDYKVTVRDIKGCVYTSDAIIIPTPLPLQVRLKNNAGRCSGAAFGTLELEVNGGSAPYSYLWSNGATTQNLNDVPTGDYSVTIVDSKKCSSQLQNILIINPLQRLRFETVTKKDIRCNGQINGAVKATIVGGQAPFSFNWSRGEEHILTERVDSMINLTQGGISLVVTDNLGCVIKSDTLFIVEPSDLSVFTKNISHVSCRNQKNGAVEVRTTGGVPAYKYLWSNGLKTENLFNAGEGTYRLTVTDANSCSFVSSPYTILAPTKSLSAHLEMVQSVTCKGGRDGRIVIKADNAAGPISYMWNHDPLINKNTADDLKFGSFSVSVTDSIGCSSILKNIYVAEPLAIGIVLDSIMSSTCKGENKGRIKITATGGTSPYTYLWSNSKTSESLSGLSDGVYIVSITDSNGCKFVSEEINLDSGDSLIVKVSVIPATLSQKDGSATVSVSGGMAPYGFQWSDENLQITRTAINLSSGEYSVTVVDAKGCSKIVNQISIKTTAAATSPIIGTVNLYPNPSDGTAFLDYELETITSTLDLHLVDIFGREIALYEKLDPQKGKLILDLKNAPKGVYLLKLHADQNMSKILKLIIQ
ncbi:MAG: proprotein convertase P-domain-containing protein [Saprospiraceae bacterium]